MLIFPNCKINLGLNIRNKRSDGYHNIDTGFYPLPLHEVLEIVPADEFRFSLSGLAVEGNENDNLCVRAYRLLKKDYPDLPLVDIFLYKAIPTGAGLGGGSADGAFTLLLINQQFHLNLSTDQLITYALQLGSDCPFFIVNRPCIASGRGEILERMEIELSAYSLLVVLPDIHISTSWAFAQAKNSGNAKPFNNIISRPIADWKEELRNDFEEPVFSMYPELRTIKRKLYDAGAIYASMSGSGSAFFGIFEKNNIPSISFENNFRLFPVK